MLYYDRIDFSEGIDTEKTIDLCECIVVRYNCFHHKHFSAMLYNGFHNLMQ